MNLFTMRRLAAALVLGGLVLCGSVAHGQTKKQPAPAPKPAPAPAPKPSPKPCPCPTPRPVSTVNTGGALGQLQRAAGIGAGSSHTGVTFDGRSTSGNRSASDVYVKPAVDVRCCQPTPVVVKKKKAIHGRKYGWHTSDGAVPKLKGLSRSICSPPEAAGRGVAPAAAAGERPGVAAAVKMGVDRGGAIHVLGSTSSADSRGVGECVEVDLAQCLAQQLPTCVTHSSEQCEVRRMIPLFSIDCVNSEFAFPSAGQASLGLEADCNCVTASYRNGCLGGKELVRPQLRM